MSYYLSVNDTNSEERTTKSQISDFTHIIILKLLGRSYLYNLIQRFSVSRLGLIKGETNEETETIVTLNDLLSFILVSFSLYHC